MGRDRRGENLTGRAARGQRRSESRAWRYARALRTRINALERAIDGATYHGHLEKADQLIPVRAHLLRRLAVIERSRP